MNLFMNMIEHPEMFMNNDDIPTSNQGYYKYDSFAELMNSQKQVNDSLQTSFKLLEKMYYEQQYHQNNKWNEITNELTNLSKNNEERHQFELKLIDRLNDLDHQRSQIEQMLANEDQLKAEFTKQMNHIIESHETSITAKLNQYGTSHEKLSEQLSEVRDIQQTMSEKMTDQSKEQTHIKERLENQEALMEKVSRQLTYFRSVLFERTNELAEKIEESYELTSSYLYQLLTGSDEPFSTFLMKRKKKQMKSE